MADQGKLPDVGELLQQMMESGIYDERMTPLLQQMGMGQKLMGTPSAQGREVGNTYVASSPLEHMSNAIRQVLGARMAQKSMQGEGALADQRGAGRLAYMKQLLQQYGQQPQTPPPVDPASGSLGGM